MAEEISIEEAQTILGVTKAMIYAHIRKGDLAPL
jgi:hypothetical protein